MHETGNCYIEKIKIFNIHIIYELNVSFFCSGDIVESFLQRISTQLNHVNHLLWTLFDVVSTKHRSDSGEFTRDAFGLHTVIVIITTAGKV